MKENHQTDQGIHSHNKEPENSIPNKNEVECKTCKSVIKKDASICPSCQQRQNKLMRLLHTPLFATLIPLIASGYAIYKATIPPEPKVDIYIKNYNADSLDLSAHNIGSAPTAIRTAQIVTTQIQTGGEYSAKAIFDLNDLKMIEVGENREISIDYSLNEYNRAYWTNTNYKTEFSLEELRSGKNVTCELTLRYLMPNTNISKPTVKTSKTHCIKTMEWLAREVGPLKQ